MVGLYFSGTGNTKHCVEAFVSHYDNNSHTISIENADVKNLLSEHDMVVFGFPVYYSNIPKIVRDFITNNSKYFRNKKIFIIATMGLFSGDGAGCAARIFKRYDMEIVGGLHLQMPDCIGDEKVLKKPLEGKLKLFKQADKKIYSAVEQLKCGNPPQNGLDVFSHAAGLFGQRLWFYNKVSSYKEKPDVDNEKCIGCGRCAALCPMQNLNIVQGKARSNGRCTLCYRCFSHCPTKALTILGKQVHEQYLFDKYQ